MPDQIKLDYWLDDDGDSHWLFRDTNSEFIAEFNQPDLKAAFLAGYEYALRK